MFELAVRHSRLFRGCVFRLLRRRAGGCSARPAPRVAGVGAQASTIAEELLKTEYDAARLVFNRFQSAIAFKPTVVTVLSPDALEKEVEAGGSLDQYEVEGPDRAELLQDLGEFQLATVRGRGAARRGLGACAEWASGCAG